MRKNQQSGRDGWASKEQDQKEFTLWINHRNH